MRCLALDVGDERIGVAVSDEGGALAQPLEVIARVAGAASYLRLAEIIARYGVSVIVVGLPLLADGSEGKQARSARAYVRGLQQHIATPVVYWDERYTTADAHQLLSDAGATRRRRQRRIDAVAAAVILQQYLNDQAGGSTS